MSFDRTNPRSVLSDDVNLARLDTDPSGGVADSAGHYNVARRVIERITVRVVGNNGPTEIAALADHPIDFRSAPMTRVRARPDAIKQNGAGLTDQSGFPGQKVFWRIPYASVRDGILSACSIAASLGTELSDQARRAGVFDPAMLAVAFHTRIIAYKEI